jgi:pSer/pThr/pTyr-binding forkhead associated (FHA) protein
VPPIPLASNPPSAPRLEFFRNGSDELQRVTIEDSPFRIGRCETSHLRIDSVQVSREHAQIYQRGNIWIIRDLGSTNGTQVNGKLVRESFLSDGDIVTIAETEVTFVASSVTPFQRMATQPIQPRESAKPPALLPSEIAVMRALTEATLWQVIPLQLATIVSLESGEREACFAQLADATNRTDPELQFNANHPVSKRYRELSRRRAIEMAEAQITANRIFLTADLADFESPRQLFSDLEQLRDRIPLDSELGVTISLPRTLDPTALDDVCREVRKAELLLEFVNFQGSSGQVLELESRAPEYLVLSDTMMKGVTASSQPLRRLELVLTTCQQLGIKAVLPECGCQKTIAQCRQLGYEFAVQMLTPGEAADHSNMVAVAG